MKKKLVIIGIDVSKAILDVYVRDFNFYFKVENGPKGFIMLLETACNVAKCKKDGLFFCFENTGKYSKMLSVFLQSQSIAFSMEPALKIKKSLGMARGKNDKADSIRIAQYAYEKWDSLELTVLPGSEIDQIKSLLSARQKLIKHRTAYKNGLTDLHDCYKEGENDTIKEIQKRLIKQLNEEIEYIETQILNIIKQNESMLKNFKLILSVKGVGKILGLYLIAYTANFTQFANARSFACYVGIAPFENSSGTVKGKSRIHPFGNKQLKSLLNLAASSVIQRKGEFGIYYNHRINVLKKSPMSTLNIIRNKIVFRVFAVIHRKTPYVDLYKFAA